MESNFSFFFFKAMRALVSRNWLNYPFIIRCPRSGARNIKKMDDNLI